MTILFFNALLQTKEDILVELNGLDLEQLRFRAGYIQALADISKTDFEDIK